MTGPQTEAWLELITAGEELLQSSRLAPNARGKLLDLINAALHIGAAIRMTVAESPTHKRARQVEIDLWIEVGKFVNHYDTD